MVGGLKSKLKDGKKEKERQGKRGRGVTRLVRSASCKFSKAKTQDKKLYHRFSPRRSIWKETAVSDLKVWDSVHLPTPF